MTGNGYAQAWLRGDRVGDRDQAHVHEGLRLADGSGWVGVGGTICDNCARQVQQSIILCVMTTMVEKLLVDYEAKYQLNKNTIKQCVRFV